MSDMHSLNLVYVHIGKELPECFLDNIYQMLLLNYSQLKVYILLDDELIEDVKHRVLSLNTVYFKDNKPIGNQIQFIRNSLIERALENCDSYKMYTNCLKKFDLEKFRSGFWISTTKRFFYIWALTHLFYIDKVFHIENDVVLYDSLNNVYNDLLKRIGVSNGLIDQIVMVKDSPDRVIPSIMYIPDKESIIKLVDYISVTLNNSNVFLNDMSLLAGYPYYYTFNVFPSQNQKYLFDGAAIGQFIDGTDIRNLPNLPPVDSPRYKMLKYNNPTRGFVNETSIYKPDMTTFYKKLCNVDNVKIPLNIMLANTESVNSVNIIPNVHVHSKQLYKFSSVFDMNINDIISGDRIIGLCDYVISTHGINNFHRNIEQFIDVDKIILIKDFNNINYDRLNVFLGQCGKKCIKLFIYTHLLEILLSVDFFNNLDKNYQYVLYLHNSDHSLNQSCKELVNEKHTHITKIYTQNPDIESPKVNLLPIGLANSMWPHGNMLEFYNVMKETYMYKKSNGIYININPSTYGYRSTILDKLKENNWRLSQSKPYNEYLYELSTHYFCLCVRGNGIDTHRFWESLYLGVIPVIINNQFTNCQIFVDLLNKIGVPFYEIKSDDIFSNICEDELFNEKLFTKIISNVNNSIQNLNCLKLGFYNQSG
jgi:hypothetical protein